MAQTTIPAGSALAVKVYGAALFARNIQAQSLLTNLTGPAPKQSDAEAKLKGQTSKDMPIVRITDLSKSSGDRVTVDCFDTINGKPLMGDKNAENKGEALSSSSMEIAIALRISFTPPKSSPSTNTPATPRPRFPFQHMYLPCIL